MNETVTFFGKNFEIRRSSSRKTISLCMDGTGKYFLRCPDNIPRKELSSLISDDAKKFIDRMGKKFGSAHAAKEYKEGEMFLFKGEQFPLVLTGARDAPSIELRGSAFVMAYDRREQGFGLFEAWYQRQLYENLRALLPEWSRKLNVRPLSVHIKTVKSIWGSCSPKKSLTFCTRLALVPPPLLEYVIAHELVHLIHMNHSPLFWAALQNVLPNCYDSREALKKNSILYRWW